MTWLQRDHEGTRVIAALAALFVLELLLCLKEGSLLRDVNLFLFPILIEGVMASAIRTHRNRVPAMQLDDEPVSLGDLPGGTMQTGGRRG